MGTGFGSRLDVKIDGTWLLNNIIQMNTTIYQGNASSKEADFCVETLAVSPTSNQLGNHDY